MEGPPLFEPVSDSISEAAAPNALNGLPDRSDLRGHHDVGALFDPAVANLRPEWKIEAAIEMEKAGKSVDKRIKTFESVGAQVDFNFTVALVILHGTLL